MNCPKDYPANARYAAMMADREGYFFSDLDDGNGYLFKLSSDSRSFISGAGLICSYPINSATSHEIARDKAHSKAVLSAKNIDVIPGKLFFVHDRFKALQPPNRDIKAAILYTKQLGYPVFCKPNRGARGDFAQIIRNETGLIRYISEVSKYYDSILIEDFLPCDEYRVLIFDNKPIYQLMKTYPAIVGDGVSAITQLIGKFNERISGYGLSDIDISSLSEYSEDPDHILENGQSISIIGRQNLSSFGGYRDFTMSVDNKFAEIAKNAVQALYLRFAAVDLFFDPVSGKIIVIEVNSNPSITALEQAGEIETILNIWATMAGEFL